MQWKIGRKSEYVIGCPRKSVLIRNFRWSVSGDLAQDESQRRRESERQKACASGKTNEDGRNLFEDGGPDSRHLNANEGYYSQGPSSPLHSCEQQVSHEEGLENDDSNGMYVNGTWIPMSDMDQYAATVDGGDFLEPLFFRQIPVLFHPLPSVSHAMYPGFRTMHSPDASLYPNYFIPSNPHYFYYLTRPCAPKEDDVGNVTQDMYYGIPPEVSANDQLEGTIESGIEQQEVLYAERNQDTEESQQMQVAENIKEEPMLPYPYPGYGFGEPVYSVPVYPVLNPPVQHLPRIPWPVVQAQKRRRRRRKEDYADYAYIPPKKTNEINLKEVALGTTQYNSINSESHFQHCCTQKEANNSGINYPVSRNTKGLGDPVVSQKRNNDESVKNEICMTAALQYIAGIVDEIILLAQTEVSKKSSSVKTKIQVKSAKTEEQENPSIIHEIFFELFREITAEVTFEAVGTSELVNNLNTSETLITDEVVILCQMEPYTSDSPYSHNKDHIISTGGKHPSVPTQASSEYPFFEAEHSTNKTLCEFPDVNKTQNKTTESSKYTTTYYPKENNIHNVTENMNINGTQIILPELCVEKNKADEVCLEHEENNHEINLKGVMSESIDEVVVVTNNQNSQNSILHPLYNSDYFEKDSDVLREDIYNKMNRKKNRDSNVPNGPSQSAPISVLRTDITENSTRPDKHKSSENETHSLNDEDIEVGDATHKHQINYKKIKTPIHCENHEIMQRSMKEKSDEKDSFFNVHHTVQHSYHSYLINSEALIRETELELSKLQQLTARSALHASQSIYTLAYDSNVTDQSETDEPITPIPSPVSGRADFSVHDEMNQDIPRAEIVVHEADSASDAGSEDVELLPHRYESRNGDSKNQHGYVNKLSLAMELLKTHENLPYDDEFKRVVAEDNDDGQNSKTTIVCSKGNSPAKSTVLVGNVNLGFIGDSSAFKEKCPIYVSNIDLGRNIMGSSGCLTTTVSTDNVEHSHRKSRVSTADSGVQSEDSGDETGEEAKEAHGSLRFTEFEDQELWNPADSPAVGYRRFGAQARQHINIFTPRAGFVNPCFCCVIM